MNNTTYEPNGGTTKRNNIFKVIAAIVITAIVAFFVYLNLNGKFNIEHDNWSIMINENGEEYAIKLRQASKEQAFELISQNGEVDFKVEDEEGNNVLYNTRKKFLERNKYTIYPKNKLEEGKYYHLSLIGDTIFSEGEFKVFKELYFTVKRNSVNECSINQNIETEKYINMSEEQVNVAYRNGEIKKGSIILMQDKIGDLVCKTLGEDGAENASLEDVFTNMNVAAEATELKFNPDKIDFDGIFKQDEIINNVYNSDFFKNLVKEVYYENKEFKEIDKSEIMNMITIRPYVDKIDNSRIGVRAAIKLENGKLKSKYADVEGDVIVLLDLSCAFKFTPDIDLRNKDELKIDVQFEISPRQYIDVEIAGGAEGNEKLMQDIFNVADTDNNYIEFSKMSIPVPGLYYDAGVAKAGLRVDVPIGFVPQVSAKLKLNYKQYKDNVIKIGITNNSKNGNTADYTDPSKYKTEVDDDWYFNLKGLLYASVGVRMEPKLIFEVSVGSVETNDAMDNMDKKIQAEAAMVGYVGFGLESGPYIEFVGGIEARKDSEVNTSANMEMGIYTQIDFVSNITLKGKLQVFKINVGGEVGKSGKHIFINNRYPFFEYPNSWYMIDTNKDGKYDYNDKWYYYEISRYNNKKGWYDCIDDGQRYYLDPENDGEMIIGLKKIGDEYYYFSKDYSKKPSWDKYDIRSKILENFKNDNVNSTEYEVHYRNADDKELNIKVTSKSQSGKIEPEYDKTIKKYEWIGKEKMKSLGSMYRNEEIPIDEPVPEGYTRRVDSEGRLVKG